MDTLTMPDFEHLKYIFRVHAGQGNLEISGNCEGILKIQEKVSETWKKLMKVSEFGKRKVMDAS